MTLKKITWKSIIPNCYKTERPLLESRKQVSKFNSFQMLSFSDLSNAGSSLSVDDLSYPLINANLHVFTFKELRVITHNFSFSNMIGEGGFGPVYKGFIDDKLKLGLEAQPVAVKLLDLDGLQGHREWLVSVSQLIRGYNTNCYLFDYN